MQPMKFILSIIAAIGIVKLNAMADTTRIYAGHNATGSAIYAYDTRSGRLYKGHNATGSAAWIYDSRSGRIFRGHNATGSAAYAIKGDLPKAIIVFLAEKLLD